MSPMPYPTARATAGQEGHRLRFYVGVHSIGALAGWFLALMITGGGAAYPPYLLAIAYTVALGSLLQFLHNNGASRGIWLVGLPLAALFVVWSRPCGIVFSTMFPTSFLVVRNLEQNQQNWALPGILYGAGVIFMLVY